MQYGQFLNMPEDVVQTVGGTIRRLRQERGYSQESFAQHAKLDRAFYGRIERGTQNVALTTLCIVADALGTSPSALLADVTAGDCARLRQARESG